MSITESLLLLCVILKEIIGSSEDSTEWTSSFHYDESTELCVMLEPFSGVWAGASTSEPGHFHQVHNVQ